MINGDLIDQSVFSQLQEATGSDFIKELVETFLEEGPGIFAELRSAISTRNADQFRRGAHSIKSNAQTFGAARLAEQARKIEITGLAADMEANSAQISALDVEFQRTALALKSMLNG